MPSVKFGFTGKNVDARQWAEKNSAKLVTRIGGESKAMIRALIVRSIAEGIPPYEAARQIRSMVGLTRPQAGAVSRFRARLMGRGLSSASVNKQVDRYIKKNIRRRAETIARTEVVDALTAGQQASMQQAQQHGYLGNDAKKRWVASFGACKICAPLGGSTRKVNESWLTSLGTKAHPTAHPNCRCTIMPIPGKGIPATPAERQAIASAGLGTKVPITPSGQIQNGADARQAILAHQESAEMRALADEIKRLQLLHEEQTIAIRKTHEARRLNSRAINWRDRNKLDKKLLKERKTLRASQEGQLEKVRRKIQDSYHENFLFNPTELTRVTIEPVSSTGKAYNLTKTSRTPHVMPQQASFDRATQFFRRTVDDDLYTTTVVRKGTTAQVERVAIEDGYTIRIQQRADRAHAYATGNRSGTAGIDLRTTTVASQETIVHELSHTIEFANVDVLTEAVRLRRGMTFAEKKAMRLSKSTGDPRLYDEYSWLDNAKTIQNPDGHGSAYTWKKYGIEKNARGTRATARDLQRSQSNGYHNMVNSVRDGWDDATEVVTVGMQQMFMNPAALARDQPKLFDFIYERILRRKYTHQTSKYAVDPTKALKVPKELLKKNPTFREVMTESEIVDGKLVSVQKWGDSGRKITGNYFEIDEAVFVEF